MPPCKNDPKRLYTGNEPSPKGLGFCAHAMKLNSKKRGRDGNVWIVKQTTNGFKRWVKFSGSKTAKTSFISGKSPKKQRKLVKQKSSLNIKPTAKKSAQKILRIQKFWKNLEKAYEINPADTKYLKWNSWLSDLSKSQSNIIIKIVNKVGPDLTKADINFVIVPFPPNIDGYYAIDFVWDYAQRELKEYDDVSGNLVIMVVRLDANNKLYHTPDMLISLQHNLDKKHSESVLNIFKKHLEKHVVWNGSPNKAIIVK